MNHSKSLTTITFAASDIAELLVMWFAKRRICSSRGLLESYLVPGTIKVNQGGSTVTVSKIGVRQLLCHIIESWPARKYCLG